MGKYRVPPGLFYSKKHREATFCFRSLVNRVARVRRPYLSDVFPRSAFHAFNEMHKDSRGFSTFLFFFTCISRKQKV